MGRIFGICRMNRGSVFRRRRSRWVTADEGGARSLELPERGEEAIGGMIDEEDEFLTRDAFGIHRPVPPLETVRNDRPAASPNEVEFLVLVFEDL
jgi:hypothetical protein